MTGIKTILDTPWFRLEAIPYTSRNGSTEPYYCISQHDGVVIIALTVDGDFILVRQERLPLGRPTVEVPAGFMDGNETPEAAARRELYEETGYIADEVNYLGPGRSLMNRINSHEHMIFITGAVKDPDFQAREDIEPIVVRPGRFREMIENGEFEQMSALAVLFIIGQKFGRTIL